jgi:AcrR family transcriptional regulator
MNRTKRKIFDTAIKLFAEKGYSETSVEEITAVTGIAKGTLYYHFAKKEDIFNFLVEEGMKLIKNSIEIKTSKQTNSLDKLRAIMLIQIKTTVKYEELITLILSQMWGKKERNIKCQQTVFEYINIIENVLIEGMKKGEIRELDHETVATSIFGIICSSLTYKMRAGKEIQIEETCDKFFESILNGIKND